MSQRVWETFLQSQGGLLGMGQSRWWGFLVLSHKDEPRCQQAPCSFGMDLEVPGVLCEGLDTPICEQQNRTHFGRGTRGLCPRRGLYYSDHHLTGSPGHPCECSQLSFHAVVS